MYELEFRLMHRGSVLYQCMALALSYSFIWIKYVLRDSFRACQVTGIPASWQQHLAGVLPPGLGQIGALGAPPPSRTVLEPCSGAGPKAHQIQKAGDEKQGRKEEEKTRG